MNIAPTFPYRVQLLVQFVLLLPLLHQCLSTASVHRHRQQLQAGSGTQLLAKTNNEREEAEQRKMTAERHMRPQRRKFYYDYLDGEDEDEGNWELPGLEEDDEGEDDRSDGEDGQGPTEQKTGRRRRRAFGKSDYLLPENFRSLRRKDIPVTYRLHDDLLRYYRKGTRPVTHPSKIISVSMSVFLYQIIKLDAVKNTISLSGSFELYWQDEFLRWEPDSYEGAREIFLTSTDIWIPEFSLYYSVNFNDAVKLQSNNDVRVNHTGHVRYWIPFSTESLCNSMDVKFFPFDIQRCTLLLGSWAHSNDSIKYSLFTKNLSLIDFYDNQEWQLDLSQSHITSDGFLYDYLDPPLFWEMIVIDLVVARQSFYYVFNLVIPSALITLVAVIGFHTPSNSGKKRGAKFRQGIMTLMSMSMILLAIVEDMPKFSMSSNRSKNRGSFSGIPLIGLYYFMLLVIVSLSTVTSSFFVYMERYVRIQNKIPFYLRWMIAIEHKKRQIRNRYSFRKNKTDRCHRVEDTEEATRTHGGYLNGSVNAGLGLSSDSHNLLRSRRRGDSTNSLSTSGKTTQNVAISLLKLVDGDKGQQRKVEKEPNASRSEERGRPRRADQRQRGSAAEEQQQQQQPQRESSSSRQQSPMPQTTTLPSRKRHSLLMPAPADSSLLVQQCLLEELARVFAKLERTVADIQRDVAAMVPHSDLETDWQKAIRRLELCSLAFYVTLLLLTMLLFFYHDWYCAIGYNPCGQQNLKCPWLVSDPSLPSCLS